MPLTSGTRLGLYEIVDPLGAGGMGEVYRARDTKLGREVAIKILPDMFASDVDRIARFEREAKVLASVNHPHIAALFGMEQGASSASGAGPATIHFLVMELVDGDTLAERLQRGPIPLGEALRIALQIAEALEAAHEKGIVHRDLKPANVKIGRDDRVKVLDFGLAKAMESPTSGAGPNVRAVTHSPTLSMAATQAGMILGTAAYMSPEQAKGLPADQRSDVFSFGVVLYEMLTGRQPFQGETAPDVLASVLVRDPDLSAIAPTLDPRLLDLLKRCLDKNPRRRWQAIGDVRVELETITANPSSRVVASAGATAPLWKRALLPLALTLIASAITAVVTWNIRPAVHTPLARFTIEIPDTQPLSNTLRRYLAISPDGTQVVYVADRRLYLRALSSFVAQPLTAQTAGGMYNPAFSPDGLSVAYNDQSDGTIKRIALTGGVAVTVCSVPGTPFGIVWSGQSIYFGQTSGIMRVPDNGGKPEMVAKVTSDEQATMPQISPDGQTLLFTILTGVETDRFDKGRVVAESLTSHERITVIDGGSDARYVSTGHLVYVVSGVLFAAPFDIKAMKLTGAPVPIVEGVRRAGAAAQVNISETGSLIYVPGPAVASSGQANVAFIDRKGIADILKIPAGPYQLPRLSPDGKRIAFGSDDGKDTTIWIYDLSGESSIRRLTFEGQGRNRFPVWSANSERVTFQSDREKDFGIFWQRADGSGTAERLTKADAGTSQIPEAWSPDGDHLLYNESGKDPNGSTTLWMFSLKTRKAERFDSVVSPASTLTTAVFSPDGKWIAYASREGRVSSAIYVQPVPPSGAKYQVSRNEDDGHHPVWSPTGKELFYTPGPGTRMNVVTVSTQPNFTFGEAVTLPRPFSNAAPSAQRTYDISRDGQRFLGLLDASQGAQPGGSQQQIQVVVNWFEELKQRVPLK